MPHPKQAPRQGHLPVTQNRGAREIWKPLSVRLQTSTSDRKSTEAAFRATTDINVRPEVHEAAGRSGAVAATMAAPYASVAVVGCTAVTSENEYRRHC